MSIAAITTLAILGLIVAALAFYLLWVAVLLVSVNRSLGGVLANVRTVAQRAAPIGPAVDDVNSRLATVADALEGLIHRIKPPAKAS